MKRRTLLVQTGSLALLLGLPHLARGASLLAVRMWPSNDYTRVTIESDVPLTTKHHMLSDPERFVVDIEGMQLNEQVKELSALVQESDPYVSAIRVGQYQPDVVRIVFDLKQRISPNVFTLNPFAEYKDRLVFDFTPVDAPDPLNQLISEISSERTSALNQGNHSEADILGDWLAQQQNPGSSSLPAPAATASDTPVPSTTASNRRPTPSKIPGEAAPPASQPSATTTAPVRSGRLYIIALDPGHGGEDPGAVGPSGTREKDVVLSIGKLLRDQINAQADMRAFMTRDSDFFVPLAERVQKARSVKADLFISIHADAFTNRSAKGASVFALSERGASSTTASWLANTQNQSDLIGGVGVRARDRQTAGILLSMSTAAQIKDSLKLGKLVVKELSSFAHMHKNTVEQAGFAVLKAPDIPSILVETAFISNPEEEKLLRSAAYQKQLAQAMMRAIKAYLVQNPPSARS
ncbi:N-acetylmuramoyl-L-alanine amidase [Saezia sanguinis]|uniref:N-acetylmuramoyl-L-alanine amidase n=1 Tax=Saezia sanguinis TaxID=1965230 RepID=UPI00304B5124